MNKKIICILCPKGCTIEKVEDGDKVEYAGYGCKRGYNYALDEFKNPKRILTTTIYVENGEIKFLPVRTNRPIPKDMIFEAISLLKKKKIEAPVRIGQIVVENILNTGADVIATRNVDKRN